MKKNITFLVFSILTIVTTTAQNEKYIQVEMADETASFSFIGAPTYYYDMPVGATDYSNDAGLNAILDGNNVLAYDMIESIPDIITYGAGYSHWTLVKCDNCDHNQLAADLNAYSSVVKNAYPLDDRLSYNQLYVKILDINIGVPTGTSNGIITTNDTGLNTIFQNNNVHFFNQAFPSSSQNSLLRAYFLLCDCNAVALKADMEAYNSVIELAERMDIESQLLSTPEVLFPNVELYPNPLQNTLFISNSNAIKSLEIYTIQGKNVLSKNKDLATIDVSELKSGLYFVKLVNHQQKSQTFKIIKQ